MPINNENENNDENSNNTTDNDSNNDDNNTDNDNKFARSLMWGCTLAYRQILWASRTALFGCEYPSYS